ncbi:class I SAM-dependent methyltransferase [Actinokineospora sp. HUAS TT18]|uniref:class I SAM-dependent methyltransferase n=1 Tax=Actinokineospora sp. HUAS TT18 TaxID=3447451 RepID=UPI003F527F08
MTDPDRATQLAVASGGDYRWFETLYAEALRGEASVPWHRSRPNVLLTNRLTSPGSGRALVVGSGYGDDAEYIRSLGYSVTAFDFSPSAVAVSAERFPSVDFHVADVLSPPAEWSGAFDLVYEAYTIQVLRGENRAVAIKAISDFVAPGGTLLVIGFSAQPTDDPPRIAQAMTRAELDSFGLTQGWVDERPPNPEEPPERWHYVAEFTR